MTPLPALTGPGAGRRRRSDRHVDRPGAAAGSGSRCVLRDVVRGQPAHRPAASGAGAAATAEATGPSWSWWRCRPPSSATAIAAALSRTRRRRHRRRQRQGRPAGGGGRRVDRAPARYVGSHPMAGSERSGPLAASAALFDGRPWAVTPHATVRPRRAWRLVEALVLRVRCRAGAAEPRGARPGRRPHLAPAAPARRARRRRAWPTRPPSTWRCPARACATSPASPRGDPALWQQILARQRRGRARPPAPRSATTSTR